MTFVRIYPSSHLALIFLFTWKINIYLLLLSFIYIQRAKINRTNKDVKLMFQLTDFELLQIKLQLRCWPHWWYSSCLYAELMCCDASGADAYSALKFVKKCKKTREITFHKKICKKLQFDKTTYYLPQRLKSTFFEKISNGDGLKGQVEWWKNFKKRWF